MKLEAVAWLLGIAALSAGVIGEGRRQHALEARVALSPKELYQQLARSRSALQIIDARSELEGYSEAHIPGAIPFPGCEPAAVPERAAERALPSVPAVIVSDTGDPAMFERCRRTFANARNLAGGMSAWSASSFPEDEGEYVPPRSSAGGGCL